MITYEKNARVKLAEVPAPGTGEAPANDPRKQGVRVNGMQQVIDMLKVADPQFRDALLARIKKENPALADNLKKKLGLR